MGIRKTILIADDAELNRGILQEFFCKNYNTLLAEDGDQTVQLLTQHEQEISLLLLDLIMPKRSGFDVLRYMKEHHLTRHIPVIVITGSSDYQDELMAYNLGASDIIHKPFVPEIVVRRAENVMELYTHRMAIEHELVQRTKELEAAFTYDLLTGLYNMQFFLSQANERLRKADEEGHIGAYTFVYGNIRNFKYHNLSHGIDEGDRVLRRMASKIKELAPDSLHARFGNDHLVSMIPSHESMTMVSLLLDYFNQEFGTTNLKLKAGIYQTKQTGETAAAACDLAKVACDTIYDSTDGLCLYTDQIAHQVTISNYVQSHLDEAIEKGYIQAYYQPVIRTISGELCGMEALARWIDPVIGFLSPADFISVLERQHMITKLDLHMLRLICRDMREAEAKKLKLIPVSFNLSRIDLLECDIFSEVEQILKEYSIPRDMINIEITESTITESPDYMRQIISSFRQAGYQVWMDDFGSEYSSLNSLKDYQFDEIKLDMKFLSTFDDTCKKIIRSVIRMAKDLGVQTLAEGVETKEQLEFLRDAGCEKAQGYYFSKPVPINQLLANMEQSGGHVETRAWRNYYNDIGTENFITERSLAIVEYDGSNFQYLFVNDAYKKVWADIGAANYDMIRQATNSRTGALGHQLRDLQKTLHKGDGAQDLIAPTRGQYIRLSIRCLAEYEEHGCYAVEIMQLSSIEEKNRRDKLDHVFREMYALYDAIYVLEMDTGKFQTLMRGSSNHSEEYKTFHSMDMPDLSLAAKAFIHPTEQEEFMAFTNLDTLPDRLKQADSGRLVHYFRSMNAAGAYTWMLHSMLYVPNGNYVVYCVRSAFFHQEHLIEKLAPEYLADAAGGSEKTIHHIFRQAVMESQTVNVFWKDRERRFINVNECFLASFGFQSASEVVGKTDEDMGWHVEDASFRKDELDVLKHGKVITNQLGRCIINGVDHVIIVNKEPMYDNGEIVGLMGTFMIADAIEGIEDVTKSHSMDHITNLMSITGFTDEVIRYVEGWRIRQENFAAIRISLTEYFRLSRTYGEHIAKDMLSEIGRRIASCFNVHGACARLFGGNFAVLMQCRTDKSEVQKTCQALSRELIEIHELLGYPVTFNPKIEIRFADETEDIEALNQFSTGGTVVDIAERRLLEEQLDAYDLQLNTVVNAIPGGIVLYEMLPDESNQIVYVSAGVGRLSGRTEEEFRHDTQDSQGTEIFEVDRTLVHQAIMKTLRHGTPLNFSFRVWHKNGSLIWINIQGRVIGEQNGHPLLLAVFQNISEATASYEDALNEAMVGVIVHSSERDDILYENKFAKQLVDQQFGGSLYILQKEVAASLQKQNVLPSDDAGEYHVQCRDDYYHIRISDQIWNGRSAKVIYIMDITSKMQEEQNVNRESAMRHEALYQL